MRYAREVIIVGTSLLGGVLAGLSLAQLGSLPEIPYGIAMSAGFAALGMLVQFALNKPEKDSEETDTDDDADDGDYDADDYDTDDYDADDDTDDYDINDYDTDK